MKLYYSPGACSLSPHIALHEAGLAADIVRVDIKAKKLADGSDFLSINPKGQVPTLQLDDGQVLTEGPAIVQYIADQAPAKGLAPAAGSFERYRLMELLNYVSTEIHKNFSPLFNPATSADAKESAKKTLSTKFAHVATLLAGKDYLMGDRFTVADGYLFTVLGWTRHVGIDLGQWPVLGEYLARVGARPAVQEAMKAEGLVRG